MTVVLDDIERAARAIDGEVVRKPFIYSRTLSAITGAELYLKLEAFQFTGSFKDRGALTRLIAGQGRPFNLQVRSRTAAR